MAKNEFDANVVRSTQLNLLLGGIGTVFFIAVWYFLCFKEEGWSVWWHHAAYALLVLLCLLLMMRYLVWRITYDETEFTVRNMFGISRTYRYSEITAMEQGVQGSKLWIGKKKITLEGISLESMHFFFYAQQQYEILSGDHDGIPERSRREKL